MSDEQQGVARPTGKRQLAGTSTTSSASYEGKRAARAKNAGFEDEKPGGGVAAFPGEVVSEMKKVVWPTAKEMVQYTLVTFAFLIVLTALVWGVDTLMGLGVEKVLAS